MWPTRRPTLRRLLEDVLTELRQKDAPAPTAPGRKRTERDVIRVSRDSVWEHQLRKSLHGGKLPVVVAPEKLVSVPETGKTVTGGFLSFEGRPPV